MFYFELIRFYLNIVFIFDNYIFRLEWKVGVYLGELS